MSAKLSFSTVLLINKLSPINLEFRVYVVVQLLFSFFSYSLSYIIHKNKGNIKIEPRVKSNRNINIFQSEYATIAAGILRSNFVVFVTAMGVIVNHILCCCYFHRVTKQSKEEFFIKWRDVPYNLSTWENPDDHVNSQIRSVVLTILSKYVKLHFPFWQHTKQCIIIIDPSFPHGEWGHQSSTSKLPCLLPQPLSLPMT